jgi:hypothetical protein
MIHKVPPKLSYLERQGPGVGLFTLVRAREFVKTQDVWGFGRTDCHTTRNF